MRGRHRLPLAHRAEDAESDCCYKVGADGGICDCRVFAVSSTLTVVFIIRVYSERSNYRCKVIHWSSASSALVHELITQY